MPPPPPCPADEVPLRTHDSGAFERADAYRRRYKNYDERCGPGNRCGSWQALVRLNRMLTVCGNCDTLCSWPRVLRATRNADRVTISAIDGCAACSNARSRKPERHAATQRRWAEELQGGTRTLIARPSHVEQPSAKPRRAEDLEAIIAAALQMIA